MRRLVEMPPWGCDREQGGLLQRRERYKRKELPTPRATLANPDIAELQSLGEAVAHLLT